MKLPDFKKNDVFKRVRSKMGIPKDYFAKFTVSSDWKEIQIREVLEKGKGIEIPLSQVDICDDNTLEYKGHKVIVYIRDQYNIQNPNKFHISWCSTLQEMNDSGRYDRYVVSSRRDGVFIVNYIDRATNDVIMEEEEIELKVCKNCLRTLNYKSYKFVNYQNRNDIFTKFSIDEFFSTFDSNVHKNPTYSDTTSPVNVYPDNWGNISNKYRESVNWKCEECGKDCSHLKSSLHVHHIDGNKFNCNTKNLKALCNVCHSKQPYHSFSMR
ncbi:MAG: HNH endonuclease [Maledivibacter sp.]|nr:HNH endonuclease [Maledivibacter sp.]